MLDINRLKKKYKDFSLDCTMSVKVGSVTALIGENGAGKSTTFKAMLGLTSYDEGEISILGKSPQNLVSADREKMGVVLTNSGFSAYLKVNDIIPVLKNMYSEFEEEKFRALCEKFQIPLNKTMKDFSTGMKAKLKVLIAVTHKAQFLLLDEPTSGLDVMARESILNLLREYMEEDEQRSILISSHISSDIESLCDDIYLISNGGIIFHEDTDVLLNDYGLLKLDQQQFEHIDKTYIFRRKKEYFGYSCLTNQKQFYKENYPDIVIEKGSVDDLISMMVGGKKL